MTLRQLCLILVLPVLGCGEFPDLEQAVSEDAKDADYPDLVPVEHLRGRAAAPRIEDETAPELEARADGLKARAARLRGTVIDDADKDRLEHGLDDG